MKYKYWKKKQQLTFSPINDSMKEQTVALNVNKYLELCSCKRLNFLHISYANANVMPNMTLCWKWNGRRDYNYWIRVWTQQKKKKRCLSRLTYRSIFQRNHHSCMESSVVTNSGFHGRKRKIFSKKYSDVYKIVENEIKLMSLAII